MKLRNKKTGEVVDFKIIADYDDHTSGWRLEKQDGSVLFYDHIDEIHEEYEDYKPIEPLIKDEKIRKAVRAWADVLEIDEAEFYGAETWIGFRSRGSRTGWLSKFEVDCFGSANTLVPFRRYTIAELCGEITDEA